MKILSVNTSDVGGGAETSAMLLHQRFLQLGHDAWMVVGDKKTDDPTVIPIHESPYVDYRPFGDPYFLAGWEAATAADVASGHEDFNYPYSRHLLDMAGTRPDVVLLHNLHGGYFDLRELPSLSAEVATFIMPHDLWLLTGHCAFPIRCDRWTRGCGSCPDLTIPPAILVDATARNLRTKADIYARCRLHAIHISRFTQEAAASSVFHTAIQSHQQIGNPVDTITFSPGSKAVAREELAIDIDAQVVLFGANGGLANPFKDGALALEVTRGLRSDGFNAELVVLGATEDRRDDTSGVREIAFVRNPADVQRYYRAADVLLHSTNADVMPRVILEAMATGLPVVAADIGEIRSVLNTSGAGLLFDPGDTVLARSQTAALLSDDVLAAKCSVNGVNHIRLHHNIDIVIAQILDRFATVLGDLEAVPDHTSDTN